MTETELRLEVLKLVIWPGMMINLVPRALEQADMLMTFLQDTTERATKEYCERNIKPISQYTDSLDKW